jgi:hypothetical protein
MSNAPAKRQRRKALTDAGRSLLNQQRQRLNREQAALGERIVNDARQAQQAQSLIELRYKPEFNAVSRGILRRVAGVLASEGVTPAISVRQGPFSAWTDFGSITVQYPGLDNDVRLTAAVLRGMLYHEGGHVRWTTPYVNLLNVTRNRMGDEAWQRLLATYQVTDFHASQFHQAWNALEDQRMETAVVSDSPRKAGYFTPVILTKLASNPIEAAANYPLLIWRRYLPRHIRVAARQAFIMLHGEDGLDLASAFEATITKYVTATDSQTMVEAVMVMEALLRRHNLAFDLDDSGHGQQRYRYDRDGKDVIEVPISPDMLNEDDDDEDGESQPVPTNVTQGESEESGEQGEGAASKDDEQKEEGDVVASTPGESKDESSKDAPVPGDAEDEGDEGDDEGEGSPTDDGGDSPDEGQPNAEPTAGSGEGNHDVAKDFQSQIDEAIAEAEAARDSDAALDGDVESFRQAMDQGHSMLPVYVGGVSQDAAKAGQAEAAAQAIEDTFMEMTMDRMPAWVEQQRRGVLNVNRYMTRQAGDVEYFKQWTDDDQPGYNLAVSILLDYSGSMQTSMAKLAQAAYASKLACQRLGIPCTVTLWDTSAATLWDGNEQAPGLPILNSAGGTDPSVALADLDNQRFDKQQHLVLVMTDGCWDGNWTSGKRSVMAYQTPGRRLIGFGYGTSASALEQMGFKDAFQIEDLMMIPKVLERVLPEMA